MANREALLDQVRRAYAARGKGALDDLMTEFHPEAVFTLVGDKQALSVTGSVQGHSAVREGMDKFISNFEFVERHILSELVEGDRAVVHSRITVRFRPKNREHKTEVLDLFRFQNGKIIELIEFADTGLIGKMMS
jgi:ketosteroid isomerase-like protein